MGENNSKSVCVNDRQTRILEEVIKIAFELSNAENQNEITESSKLNEEPLAFENLELVAFIQELENKFNFDFAESKLNGATVGSIAAYIGEACPQWN